MLKRQVLTYSDMARHYKKNSIDPRLPSEMQRMLARYITVHQDPAATNGVAIRKLLAVL